MTATTAATSPERITDTMLAFTKSVATVPNTDNGRTLCGVLLPTEIIHEIIAHVLDDARRYVQERGIVLVGRDPSCDPPDRALASVFHVCKAWRFAACYLVGTFGDALWPETLSANRRDLYSNVVVRELALRDVPFAACVGTLSAGWEVSRRRWHGLLRWIDGESDDAVFEDASPAVGTDRIARMAVAKLRDAHAMRATQSREIDIRCVAVDELGKFVRAGLHPSKTAVMRRTVVDTIYTFTNPVVVERSWLRSTTADFWSHIAAGCARTWRETDSSGFGANNATYGFNTAVSHALARIAAPVDPTFADTDECDAVRLATTAVDDVLRIIDPAQPPVALLIGSMQWFAHEAGLTANCARATPLARRLATYGTAFERCATRARASIVRQSRSDPTETTKDRNANLTKALHTFNRVMFKALRNNGAERPVWRTHTSNGLRAFIATVIRHWPEMAMKEVRPDIRTDLREFARRFDALRCRRREHKGASTRGSLSRIDNARDGEIVGAKRKRESDAADAAPSAKRVPSSDRCRVEPLKDGPDGPTSASKP